MYFDIIKQGMSSLFLEILLEKLCLQHNEILVIVGNKATKAGSILFKFLAKPVQCVAGKKRIILPKILKIVFTMCLDYIHLSR